MNDKAKKAVCLLGPARTAVSGVSTHLNQLFASDLNRHIELLHFQVGSEGRGESAFGRVVRSLFSPGAFLLFLLLHRPAIVHFNTSLEPRAYWRDLAYLAVARLLFRKIVFQVHGGALPKDFFCGNSFLTHLLRRVLSIPDIVVLLAQVELRAYGEFVPDVRLEVVPNAIEIDSAAAAEFGSKFSRSSLDIAYLGRLAENKGIFTVVDAIATLLRDGKDVTMTFVGSGPDELRLRAYVSALKIDRYVRVCEPLFGAAKDAFWRHVHIFAFPTFHCEGLPYALLEAMAAGAVPITTRVGAIPDVMQEGVHGLFVEANDVNALALAISRLYGDRAAAARMAHASRDRILNGYTVDRLANDFRRLYLDLMSS